ncbi:MAG: DUF559 domain-containing protein [Clostridia bacterium]|nr:DUF559 domain-containing protein [Clostridia bacterium]
MRGKNRLTPISKTLRKNMTPEEKHLWYDFLAQLPVTVHRQKVIGNYVVDFYIADPQIVIELDGSQHGEGNQLLKDRERDLDLQARGCQVLRYANYRVKKEFEYVCQDIWEHVFPDAE